MKALGNLFQGDVEEHVNIAGDCASEEVVIALKSIDGWARIGTNIL